MRVQLAIKIVPDTQKIYRVYSGHNRRFFDEFYKRNVAFLELPDAGLTPGIFKDVEDTRKHVRRAREIADYYRKNARAPMAQLVDIKNYNGKPDKDDRGGNSLIGSVTALFRDAKPGDLIISPSNGPYREVLYGEIKSEFDPAHAITLDAFGSMKVPVRQVRWIRRTSQEDLIPYDLSEFVAGRKAVAHIKRKGPALKFFDIAYGSYVTTAYSRAEIAAKLYRSDNFFETSELNDKIGFLIAAAVSLNSGDSASLTTLSERQAIRKFIDHDTLEYYRQHFNSPGQSTFKSALILLAPIVLIALALAASGKLSAVAKGEDVDVSIAQEIKKSDSIDHCAEYAESVKQMAMAIGVEKCMEIEQSVQELQIDLGVEVPAKVLPPKDGTADGG